MQVDIASATGITLIGIILTATVGNGMTLFIIARYDPLRDVTGMFLANLAVADLLQSIFGMPLIATSAFREEWIFGDTLCVISGASNSLFCITSILTLTAVSVDRYLAIVHPFKHQSYLTIKRAKFVLLYIWLQATVAALLPVFGWSRYVYLPYEFICTIQWEYDPAFTVFVWMICFVGPLIVTVLCYSGILKVATQQAREKQHINVGRIIEQVPDEGEAAGDDGKHPSNGRENLAFAAANKSNGNIIELSSSGKTGSRCVKDDKSGRSLSLTRRVADQAQDTDTRENNQRVVRVRSKVKRPNPSGMIRMSRKNRVAVPASPDKSSATENARASCTDSANSGLPGTNGNSLLNSPTVVVIRPPKQKITAASRDRPSSDRFTSWGRIGTSRVSPVVGGSPGFFYKWATEANTLEKELTTIPEAAEYHSESCKPPGYLARVRERIMERRIAEKQSRRKEMKVALILLVVNGTFVLCWLPHFVGALCLTFTGGSCPFPDNFFIITTTLAMLNSGCNPFIYTLTYRKFRKAFRRVLPCFCSNRSGNANAPPRLTA